MFHTNTAITITQTNTKNNTVHKMRSIFYFFFFNKQKNMWAEKKNAHKTDEVADFLFFLIFFFFKKKFAMAEGLKLFFLLSSENGNKIIFFCRYINEEHMESKLTWDLTSPFTFAKVLEYWVQQYCEVCGRGNMVCVYGQSISQASLAPIKLWTPGRAASSTASTHLQPQQDKLQQLYSCWNGVFCVECGRGGFVFPPPNPEQKPSTVTATSNPDTRDGVIAAVVGYVSKSMLHQVLRDWVLGDCSGCDRQSQPSLRRERHIPIPLSLVLDAWRGIECQICGRGSIPPSITVFDASNPPSLPCPAPHRKTTQQRHEPYKRPDVKKQHRSGLVERYVKRKNLT